MSTKRFRPDDQPSIAELRRRVDEGTVTCGICQRMPAVSVLSAEVRAGKMAEVTAMCACDDCYDAARAALIDTVGEQQTPESMQAMIEDQESRWFGYDASIGDHVYARLPEHGMVCMAWPVTADALFEERTLDGRGFKGNDWAVSTGEHEDTVVHGPFTTLPDAMKFGRTDAGAVRFLSGLSGWI